MRLNHDLWVVALCMWLLCGPAVAAECIIDLPLDVKLDFGTVTVPLDAAVGTPLGEAKAVTVKGFCPRSKKFYLQYYALRMLAGRVPQVWDTDLEGVGIQMKNLDWPGGAKIISSVSIPKWGDFAPEAITGPTDFFYNYRLSFQLIKTAERGRGGSIGNFRLVDLKSHDVLLNRTSRALKSIDVTGQVQAPSCAVLNPNITVDLPASSLGDFPSIGASGGEKSFDIHLQCDSGSKVYITYTDVLQADNRSNVLTVSDNRYSAKGIGLQLFENGELISYGPQSSLPGTVNQRPLGPSDNLSKIPMSARYVAIDSRVIPGAVRAGAYFTLSYQ